MSIARPRGRPASGQGVVLDGILAAALALLDEGGGQGLTMRALAARLGVTPMSLYHHVGDHAGLLRALSDRVYDELLRDLPQDRPQVLPQDLTPPQSRAGRRRAAPLSSVQQGQPLQPLRQLQHLLTRYHQAVGRHPQLTLALFASPQALAGACQHITDRVTALLQPLCAQPLLWRDILIDHVHGSGLALASARGDVARTRELEAGYQQALDRLLAALPDA